MRVGRASLPGVPRVSRGPTRRDRAEMELSSGWRRRRARTEVSNASAADDSSSEAAADADMVDDLLNMSVQHVGARAARPGRAIRRANKRMKVDLAATTGDGDGSMFAELAFAEEPPPTEEEEHAGSALLCFISARALSALSSCRAACSS